MGVLISCYNFSGKCAYEIIFFSLLLIPSVRKVVTDLACLVFYCVGGVCTSPPLLIVSAVCSSVYTNNIPCHYFK